MPDGDIDVFISYKREEADKARRLLEALESAGYSAVYDVTGLNLNDKFADKLESLIRRARKVVVLWTEASCQSQWVRDEARLARDLDKYLGVVLEARADIALDLRNLHKIDVTKVNFDASVDVIVKEIAAQLGPGCLTPAVLAEANFFRAVEAAGVRGGYETFLNVHPEGRYAERARQGLAALPRRLTVPVVAAVALALLMGAGGYFAVGVLVPSSDAAQIEALKIQLAEAEAAQVGGAAQVENLTQEVAALRENADDLNAEIDRLNQEREAALASDVAVGTAPNKEDPPPQGSLSCNIDGKDGIRILDACYEFGTKWLGLGGTQIADASPISKLTSLTELYLYDTQVTDAFPLSGLKYLTQLSINGTEIADASPLSTLTSLKSLDLGYTQIENAWPLFGLVSLNRLSIAGTHIADASPLSSLTALKRLDIYGTPITNLAPLRPLTNLHRLRTQDGQIIGSGSNNSENRKAVADYIAGHFR